MDPTRLPRRVYDFLLTQPKGKSHQKNGARHLEDLAKEASWPGPVGKSESKTRAKKFIFDRHSMQLKLNLAPLDAVHYKVSISDLSAWTDVSNPKAPAYLRKLCPIGLRRGRKLKTRIRLGCHDLNQSLSRQLGDKRKDSDKICQCCNRGAVESPQHALLECPLYKDMRALFFSRADDASDGFSSLSDDKKMKLLFSDDTPTLLGSHLYRFLMNVFGFRKCWLVDPTARGEGLRPAG
jgi:hypothetical protein